MVGNACKRTRQRLHERELLIKSLICHRCSCAYSLHMMGVVVRYILLLVHVVRKKVINFQVNEKFILHSSWVSQFNPLFIPLIPFKSN